MFVTKYGLADSLGVNTGQLIKAFLRNRGIEFDDKKNHRFVFDGFRLIVKHDHETIAKISRMFNPFGDFEERYGVIIFTKTNETERQIRWLSLCDSLSIDKKISEISNTGPISVKALKFLNSNLIVEIEKEIPETTKDIILCPDSVLSFLPFSCLLDEENIFLLEKYNLSYVSTSRDLIQDDLNARQRNKTFVGLGNPNFDSNEKNKVALSEVNNGGNNFYRSLSFDSIPNSEKEVLKIEKIAEANSFKTKVLIGDDATEEALNSLTQPYILHLASHGFFISEKELTENRDRFSFFTENLSENYTNPMLFSGILLAGAKNSLDADFTPTNSNSVLNGILTADEASGLDLEGNWLTVLSACDTGSGVARCKVKVFLD